MDVFHFTIKSYSACNEKVTAILKRTHSWDICGKLNPLNCFNVADGEQLPGVI